MTLSPRSFDEGAYLLGKRQLALVIADVARNVNAFPIEGLKIARLWRKVKGVAFACLAGRRIGVVTHDLPRMTPSAAAECRISKSTASHW
jgi:hypothetical protein